MCEEIERELEQVERKFSDILFEVNKAIRQEMRKIGVRKNVVVKKIVLPPHYIQRLCEYPPFRWVWYRKTFHVKLLNLKTGERENVTFIGQPNLGGIPVEEGEEVRAEVERLPKRKRRKSNGGRDAN